MSYPKTTKKQLLFLILMLLSPFLSIILVESIHRDSTATALKWVGDSSFSFLVTYFFFFFLIHFFIFLPKRIFISFLFIQAGLWAILSFASVEKYKLRGEYVIPGDLNLIREGVTITNYLNNLLSIKGIILAIVVLVSFIVIVMLISRYTETFQLKWRIILASISIIGMVVLFNNPTLFSMRAEPHNQEEEYRKLGFVGGFLDLMGKSRVVESDDYNKEKVLKTAEALPPTKDVDKNFTPNIVLVLAEAFWDPLLLTNLSFEKDPIPYFRSLSEESSTGDLVTHVFGGGTINTEFEILTGLSTRFLPEGKETYNDQVNKPIDSLAHVLRDQGYHTTAVHTFKNWFYNRNQSYRWLGFEKFVSMEFFSNPTYIGPYIDDRELMEQTLQEIKMTKGPDFINTVTVTSHGPYDDIRYKKLESCNNSPQLTKVPQYILDLYCQVLGETDDSFKLLIEGIKEIDEPTIVIIYGDHLPMLGYDYAVYREAKYFKDLNVYEDYLKMYTTPLLIWDNFTPPEQQDKDLRLTPNFLGTYILSKAKVEKSPIFQMAEQVYNNGTHVIPYRPSNREEGIAEEEVEDYQLLQYDTLFGNQYLYDKYPIKPYKNYFLGSKRMKIKSAELVTNKKGKFTLKVKGSNFVSNTKIFVNGEEQTSRFDNENLVTATLSEDIKNEKLSIELKVLDDQQQVISTSNQYTLKK